MKPEGYESSEDFSEGSSGGDSLAVLPDRGRGVLTAEGPGILGSVS